jgi:hypothetical protein
MNKNALVIALCGTVAIAAVLYWAWFGTAQEAGPGPDQGNEAAQQLILADPRTKDVLLEEEVRPGDLLELSWVHSVEKTPWLETLEVTDDGRLKLIETKFKSFGAGVPHESEGKVETRDGYVVMSELDQLFEQYSWYHSQDADFRLKINDRILVDPEDIPHHQAVEMFVEHPTK